MKIRTLGLIALLSIGALTLAGCNKNWETPAEENAEMANPASVYCEENGGTLQIEDGAWLCLFDDGSYCEEWSYFREECEPGEIMYNTVNDLNAEYEIDYGTSDIYSEEDLKAAVDTIMDTFNNEWEIKCEMQKLAYLWDEKSTTELDYCKELDSEIEECVVFTSNFHIPDTDVQMAGAFEPNTDMSDWTWYLGRTNGWEWKLLTNGLG